MTEVVLPSLAWYLAIQLAALAALPATLRALALLPDRGYAFAKVIGQLALAYLAWALGSLGFLAFDRATLWGLLLVGGAAAWIVLGRTAVATLRSCWRTALAWEALFLIAFAAALFVRAYNAAIEGTEKPMDFALLNAFFSSSRLPAEDPWLAGFGVPYYYFGYFQAAALAKLAFVPAPVAYNLALSHVFALVVLLSASLVASLSTRAFAGADRDSLPGGETRPEPLGRRDLAAGLLAAFLVAVAGNLEAPLEWLAAQGFGGPDFWQWVGVRGLEARPPGAPFPPADGAWWFRGSRIAPIKPDGINEFPYFSYLLGDLHPHFTTLPLDLLVLGLALSLVARTGRAGFAPLAGSDRLGQRLHLGLAGMTLGALVAANTWDVPVFWLAYVGAALLATSPRLTPDEPDAPTGGAWFDWRRAAPHLLALPLGLALFSPYFVGYSSQSLGIGLVDQRTPLASTLVIFAPLLALAALLGLALSRGAPDALRSDRRAFAATTFGLLAVGALGAFGEGTLALLAFLAVLFTLAGWILLARRAEKARFDWQGSGIGPKGAARGALLFAWWLGALALLVLVAVEFVFVRDSFGTRMNTVFKLHYNAWLLLGLTGAFGIAFCLRRGGRALAGLGASLAVAALVLGLVYPLAATWSKSNGFRGAATLDGARFLRVSQPDDWRAITWLASQPGRPRVLEAVGPDYRAFGRVATFSGSPTLIGWVGHELQWRGSIPELGRREATVDRLYTSEDVLQAVAVLQREGVEYVFVGSLERQKYGTQVALRFEGALQPVLREGSTVLYRVPPTSALAARVP